MKSLAAYYIIMAQSTKKKTVLTVYEIINNCEHRKQHLKTLNTFKKYLHKFHAILSRKKYEIHHFFIIRFCF